MGEVQFLPGHLNITIKIYVVFISPSRSVINNFFFKGPHPILWAGSRAALLKIMVSGKPNFCVIYIIKYKNHRIFRGPRNIDWPAVM